MIVILINFYFPHCHFDWSLAEWRNLFWTLAFLNGVFILAFYLNGMMGVPSTAFRVTPRGLGFCFIIF